MIDTNFYTIRPAVSLGDLASELGLELPVDGATDEMINLPLSLPKSLPGSVTFFSDKRRKSQLATAKATACLTTEKLLPLVAKTGMVALVTDNPRAVFARLSERMVQTGASNQQSAKIDESADIHPTAILGKNVTIGAGSRIGANCVIEDNVKLGENCVIEPLVRLSFTTMGDACHIKSGTVIGGTGFGVIKDENGVFSVCLLYTSPSPRD